MRLPRSAHLIWLRVIDNGTENNMLRRSLQHAFHKNGAGRRITDPTAIPLFADRSADGDEASGSIYVLRSKADIRFIAETRGHLSAGGQDYRQVDRP